MVAESNVGARLTLIGKAAFLAGIKESQAAVDAANKANAASSVASTEAQVKGYATLAEAQAAYRADLAVTTAAQTDAYVALGRKLAIGLGAAAAIVGYEGLKIHAQFQSAMLQSENLAGIAQSRMAALTAGIKNMAPAVNQGLVPLANALYRIASTPAGLKATNAELLNMVKYSAMLTTIGGPGTDLEQTARIMGGVLSSGVKGAKSPQAIAQMAAATVGAGDLKMSDVTSFLGTGVMTSAKLTGIPMNQVMAYLALAGSNLMSGQVSGHAIAHGLQLMFAPTPAAQQALGVVGLGATTLAQTGRNKGLGAATAQLGQALKAPLGADADPNSPGLGATLTKFGFTPAQIAQAQTVGLGQMGSEGQSLMNLILTRMFGGAKMGIPLDMLVSENSNYSGILKRINKASGSPDLINKDMARQLDTLSGKAGVFGKSMQKLADTIGTALTPVAKDFLTVATDVANVLGKNEAVAGALGGAISLVLGPAIVIYGIRKFQAMGSAIADVVKGFAGAVGAVARFVRSLGGEDTAILANDNYLDTNTADEAANNAGRVGGATGLVGKVLGGVKYAGPVAISAYGIYHDTKKIQHPGASTGPMIGGGTLTDINRWLGIDSGPTVKAVPLPSIKPIEPHSGLGWTSRSDAVRPVNVYIDGKKVFSAIQKQTKTVSGRN
jgi:hypothetical protein